MIDKRSGTSSKPVEDVSIHFEKSRSTPPKSEQIPSQKKSSKTTGCDKTSCSS